MTDARSPSVAPLNRVLLREAGEHLGTLAEQEHEAYLLGPYHDRQARNRRWERYAKLARIAKEVLEIANG